MVTTASRASSPIAQVREELEEHWSTWLTHFFAEYLQNPRGELVPMAPYHQEFWDAIWAIHNGELPRIKGAARDAFFAIWSRGTGKSTSTELGVAALAARKARRYCLYVSDSQDQADQHVANIGDMLTSKTFASLYPAAADRKMGKYGPASWRRNRLMTASGFTLDAIGLEKSVRGLKQEDQRPDLIILDDIDDINDSGVMTDRKMRTLSRSILPAASPDAVVIMVQNLILLDGIMDRLVHNRADFLRTAYVSGPHPAITGLQYHGTSGDSDDKGRWIITGGESTWAAKTLVDWEVELNRMGPAAFLAECQHQLSGVSDRVYPDFEPGVHQFIAAKLPPFRMVIGGLDFGGEGRTANETAGLVAGVGTDNRITLLAEFKDNGVNVDGRLMEWMQAQEYRWKGPGSILWAADGTESMGIRAMKRSGFNIKASRLGGKIPLREFRVKLVGTRVTVGPDGLPGIRYIPSLRKFEAEMLRYRREKPHFEGDVRQRKIIQSDDHLMSALEYLTDLIDGPQPAQVDTRSRTVSIQV